MAPRYLPRSAYLDGRLDESRRGADVIMSVVLIVVGLLALLGIGAVKGSGMASRLEERLRDAEPASPPTECPSGRPADHSVSPAGTGQEFKEADDPGFSVDLRPPDVPGSGS